MKFLAKIALLCNLAFLASVFLRMLERDGDGMAAIRWEPIQNTLVIMGYGAIIINLIYLISWVGAKVIRKGKLSADWITILNALFFLAQLIYFFVLP